LVNKTENDLRFDYQQLFNGVESFGLINEVKAFHDFYLHDILFEAVNYSPSFHFDFSLVKPQKQKAAHYESTLKLRPKQ
ncbi:hypothetical protein ABTB01_20080, partial [Acinetobacter baumannii]